ncbi:MAG: hypothetical protein Tsb0032_31720 [Kiloniellaceae bacterium]
MIKRSFVAATLAAMVLSWAPGAATANQDQRDDEQRDGKSRYELAPLNHLPLALLGGAQEQILQMYLLMEQVSYLIELTTGVKVTSQDRIGLGGLFGGVFAKTYSLDDFADALEVGTVYRAGDKRLAVAMEGGELLQEHRVIVFNGDYQYDPKALPTLQQIEPTHLAKLQAYSLMRDLAAHTLTPELATTLARLGNAPDQAAYEGLSSQQLTEIPFLRELIVGKVYRGADNTLLVVIPPTIVLNR